MTAYTICGACRANNHIKTHVFADGCQCACHLAAWVEAERDTWAYTNTDRTEARRGRWYVFLAGGTWTIRHDDFESSEVTQAAYDRSARFLRDALAMLTDFSAWQSTQTPPPPAVPAVGDYIRAEWAYVADGPAHLAEGLVDKVDLETRIWVDGLYLGFINRPGLNYCVNRVLSWSPIERPKPAWHTPEPGSLWELTDEAGGVTRYVAIGFAPMVASFVAIDCGRTIDANDASITAGREVTR
jgi:hypothetical protein